MAAAHAADVDRRGRFPVEAVDALRAARALGWGVPHFYGGAGAGLDSLAEATFELSGKCAATGMIFAMHQIQVACIVRHCANSVWFEDYLRRLIQEQRLIASATSEVGVGGDVRRSIAALEPAKDSSANLVQFEKKASTISYGAHADDLLTTVRRSPESDPGDQVLVLTHFSEMDAQPVNEWDTLGMRGTCSPGFLVRAICGSEQVLPVPFAAIAAETMVPYSHIALGARLVRPLQRSICPSSKLRAGAEPAKSRHHATGRRAFGRTFRSNGWIPGAGIGVDKRVHDFGRRRRPLTTFHHGLCSPHQ